MWLAHAMFWPTLALSHYAKTTRTGALLVFTAWILLAFTHEGALVLLDRERVAYLAVGPDGTISQSIAPNT